jgi:hypothetical protein
MSLHMCRLLVAQHPGVATFQVINDLRGHIDAELIGDVLFDELVDRALVAILVDERYQAIVRRAHIRIPRHVRFHFQRNECLWRRIAGKECGQQHHAGAGVL